MILHALNIPKEEMESEIEWIGCVNGFGVTKPKLPFVFASRPGARFLAGICNEGWISGGMCYSNQEESLHQALRSDAKEVFGASVRVPSKRLKNDYVLRFPAILKYSVITLMNLQGRIAKTNPAIPEFIYAHAECGKGWIEQTIADEGGVRFYPQRYRREIIWRRSFATHIRHKRLFEGEKRLLKQLRIPYTTYRLESYQTLTGSRTRYQIRLCGKQTLEAVHALLDIPCPKKSKLLKDALASYKQSNI